MFNQGDIIWIDYQFIGEKDSKPRPLYNHFKSNNKRFGQ
jgi:hypothetical protein